MYYYRHQIQEFSLNITRLHIVYFLEIPQLQDCTLVDFLEIPQLQSDVIGKGIYTLFCFYGIHSVFINFDFLIFLKLIFLVFLLL
jgi:hypothetical protein